MLKHDAGVDIRHPHPPPFPHYEAYLARGQMLSILISARQVSKSGLCLIHDGPAFSKFDGHLLVRCLPVNKQLMHLNQAL